MLCTSASSEVRPLAMGRGVVFANVTVPYLITEDRPDI